jgi:ProP effector
MIGKKNETMLVSENAASAKPEGKKKVLKEKRLRYVITCKKTLRWLREKYPLCFPEENPLPLKIGILKNIFADMPEDSKFSRLNVRKALAFYARSKRYQHALTTCPYRYDLNGNEAEPVSEEHRTAAREKLPPAKTQATTDCEKESVGARSDAERHVAAA